MAERAPEKREVTGSTPVPTTEAARRGQDAGCAVLPSETVASALASSVLGEDQRAAGRSLLTGGEQLACLVGPTGGGKSRALETARVAGEAAGYRVLGFAPSAMAAGVLDGSSGIESDTLAKFGLEEERGGSGIDASSQSSSTRRARPIPPTSPAWSTPPSRPRRSSSWSATPSSSGRSEAGYSATLAADYGTAELETIRRFAPAWEAAASLGRAGDPSVLSLCGHQGRIEGGGREEVLQRAFEDWREARDVGRSGLLLAGDDTTADATQNA